MSIWANICITRRTPSECSCKFVVYLAVISARLWGWQKPDGFVPWRNIPGRQRHFPNVFVGVSCCVKDWLGRCAFEIFEFLTKTLHSHFIFLILCHKCKCNCVLITDFLMNEFLSLHLLIEFCLQKQTLIIYRNRKRSSPTLFIFSINNRRKLSHLFIPEIPDWLFDELFTEYL